MLRLRRTAPVVATAAFALSGCVVGPDYHRPEAPPAAALPAANDAKLGAAGVDAQTISAGMAVPARWWTQLNSPALDALVARALERNSDLKAAVAALRQARESWFAAKGAYAPSVELDLAAQRQKNADYLASPLASNANIYDLYTTQLGVTYTPDVFGGVRRQVEGAKAQADAQRFQLEAVRLTLIANLVSAAIQEAAVRDQIDANQRLIDSQRTLLKVLKAQFARGQAAQGDVAAQALAVAQAEAALPPLEKQRDQLRDQIAALAGGYPTDPAVALNFLSLSLPMALPEAVPADLVRRRPDIQAAEANLHAANAAVGVATAARLPSFTLTGAVGSDSGTVSRLLTSGNEAWTLGAGLTQPIFQGYALLHRQRAAEAALDQARAQYRSAVVTGLQNVADALHALETDARALSAAEAQCAQAKSALDIARQRYQAGETGSPPALTAEQAFEQADIARSQAKAQRLGDTVSFFQALGGGWQAEPDAKTR